MLQVVWRAGRHDSAQDVRVQYQTGKSMNRRRYLRRLRRHRVVRALVWGLEAIFLWLFWLVMSALSPAQAARAGSRFFRWLGPRCRRQRFLKRNLSLAFPARGPAEIERLSLGVWENFGAVLAEYPHLASIAAAGDVPALDCLFDEGARRVVEECRPAVYVTAHTGNWELAAAAIVNAGVPLSVVYAPQGNPLVDRMLQRARHTLGCRFIAKKNALRRLLREIRSGRSVGILPDQRVDSGEFLPFFGRLAPTTTSPAWLALKNGCPLMPVQILRTSDGRYVAIFHKPIETAQRRATAEGILGLTVEINRMFEGWISRQPQQWLCMRRRWPATFYETISR